MSTHKPHPDQEHSQEIKEALEHKPDRDDLEYWSDDLAFKLEELHDDVRYPG